MSWFVVSRLDVALSERIEDEARPAGDVVNHLNGIPAVSASSRAASKRALSPLRSMMRTDESSRAMSWVRSGAIADRGLSLNPCPQDVSVFVQGGSRWRRTG